MPQKYSFWKDNQTCHKSVLTHARIQEHVPQHNSHQYHYIPLLYSAEFQHWKWLPEEKQTESNLWLRLLYEYGKKFPTIYNKSLPLGQWTTETRRYYDMCFSNNQWIYNVSNKLLLGITVNFDITTMIIPYRPSTICHHIKNIIKNKNKRIQKAQGPHQIHYKKF